MKLSTFNEAGFQHYRDYLDVWGKSGNKVPTPPTELLDDTDFVVSRNMDIEPVSAKTKLDLANYCAKYEKQIRDAGYMFDEKFWAWLMLLNHEVFFHPWAGVRRNLALFIASKGKSREYRHLLRGPYLVRSRYRGNADFLLHCKAEEVPDYFVQIVEREEIMYSPSVLDSIKQMYFTEDGGNFTPKRGVSQAGKKGGLRRFAKVVNQLSRTYDLHLVDRASLIKMLPSEFQNWNW